MLTKFGSSSASSSSSLATSAPSVGYWIVPCGARRRCGSGRSRGQWWLPPWCSSSEESVATLAELPRGAFGQVLAVLRGLARPSRWPEGAAWACAPLGVERTCRSGSEPHPDISRADARRRQRSDVATVYGQRTRSTGGPGDCDAAARQSQQHRRRQTCEASCVESSDGSWATLLGSVRAPARTVGRCIYRVPGPAHFFRMNMMSVGRALHPISETQSSYGSAVRTSLSRWSAQRPLRISPSGCLAMIARRTRRC
jgi:hypothetical protein